MTIKRNIIMITIMVKRIIIKIIMVMTGDIHTGSTTISSETSKTSSKV